MVELLPVGGHVGAAQHRQVDAAAHAQVLLATLAQQAGALQGALAAGTAGPGPVRGRQQHRSLADGSTWKWLAYSTVLCKFCHLLTDNQPGLNRAEAYLHPSSRTAK